jgi:competence protein ComEA
MLDTMDGWGSTSTLFNKKILYVFVVLGILILIVWSMYPKRVSDTTVALEVSSDVSSEENTKIVVDVSGAVLSPGVYELETNARVVDAIKISGGFSKDANSQWLLRHLNLSSKVTDGQKIHILHEWETYIEDEIELAMFPSNVLSASEVEDTNASLISINKASKEQLVTLSGIGPVYASRIIENRPYSVIEELSTKAGLSKKLVTGIESHISL